MVGEGNESGHDRKASAADSESASEDGESVLGETTSEIETPEAEAAAPITSRRAPTPTPRSRGSPYGVSLETEGMVSPGEGLANASAAVHTGPINDEPL